MVGGVHGGGACIAGGMHNSGVICVAGGGACVAGGGVCGRGAHVEKGEHAWQGCAW